MTIAEKSEIKARAAARGLSVAAFVRMLVLAPEMDARTGGAESPDPQSSGEDVLDHVDLLALDCGTNGDGLAGEADEEDARRQAIMQGRFPSEAIEIDHCSDLERRYERLADVATMRALQEGFPHGHESLHAILPVLMWQRADVKAAIARAAQGIVAHLSIMEGDYASAFIVAALEQIVARAGLSPPRSSRRGPSREKGALDQLHTAAIRYLVAIDGADAAPTEVLVVGKSVFRRFIINSIRGVCSGGSLEERIDGLVLVLRRGSHFYPALREETTVRRGLDELSKDGPAALGPLTSNEPKIVHRFVRKILRAAGLTSDEAKGLIDGAEAQAKHRIDVKKRLAKKLIDGAEAPTKRRVKVKQGSAKRLSDGAEAPTKRRVKVKQGSAKRLSDGAEAPAKRRVKVKQGSA